MREKLGSARLLVFLTGAILFSLVLAFSASPAVRADASPNPLGVTQLASPPQAYKVPGQLVAQSTGVKVALSDPAPIPMDPPFGPNVQVWGDTNVQTRPSLVVNPVDGYIYIAFQHNNGADWDIYLTASMDNGATWLTPVALANTGANEDNPSLTVTSQGTFVLAFEDDSNPDSLAFFHSTDGVTWNLYTLNIGAVITELSQIEWPTVISQRVPGSYPDGIMFQMQAWCNDAANCDSGAHNVFWIGEANAGLDPTTWSFGLGGSYWLVDAAPGGTRIADPLHPGAWWGAADYTQALDEEHTDGTEWHMLWIIISEDGTSPTTGWLTNAVSDDSIFGAGAADGQTAIVAGTFRLSSAPTRHQIIYFYTSDGWVTPNGAALDSATTDQRAISVAGVGQDFHITYYSDAVMTDMASNDGGASMTGPQRVSDNAGTAINDERATSVYMDASGAPMVAWQDNRDGDSNIYTTGYITYQVNVDATCGGASFSAAVLIDGTSYVNTPQTYQWADGSNHIITVTPTTQPAGVCKQCVFVDWWDGSSSTTSPTYNLVVNGPTNLTARFNAQYRVEITTTPVPNLNVRIGTTSGSAPLQAFADPGQVEIEAPTPQASGPTTQYVFSNWSGDATGTTNPMMVTVVDTCLNITANFATEHWITLQTNPPGLTVGYDTTPSATGFWGREGQTYMLIVTSPQPDSVSPNDIRYRFERWAGGPTTWGWNITVGSGPATYTANFVTQYRIQIRSSHDPGPDLNTDINPADCDKPLPNKGPINCWVDANSSPNLIIQTPQGGPPDCSYNFLQWSDGNTDIMRNIGPVTGPATYMSMWQVRCQLQMFIDSSCGSSTTTPTGTTTYDYGTPVDINWFPPGTVPPGESYAFKRWEGVGNGSYTGTLASRTVTMYSAITQTAFCYHRYDVVIDTSPTGLSYEVDGVVWNAAHTFQWEEQTIHWFNVTQLTQGTGNTRYVFLKWADLATNNPNHPQLLVTASGTFTATFKTQHLVTVGPANIGNPACAPNTDCWFDEGSSAVITVTTPYPPSSQYMEYRFIQWTGDATGTSPSVTITVNSPKAVTATWATWYKVTVTTAQGSATCAPNSDCWFLKDSTATVSVPQYAGEVPQTSRYVFTSWTGDATGTTVSLTLTMNTWKNVTAGWQLQYYLILTSTCGGSTACGNPQTAAGHPWYNDGAAATVSITTPFEEGGKTYEFTGWSGAGSGTDATTTITMDSAKTLTASWQEKQMGIGMEVWLILIIIIIVVVVLIALLMLKRKKPAPTEEPLSPEEMEMEAPPPPKK